MSTRTPFSRRQVCVVAAAAIALLGTWVIPINGARGDSYQPLMHATIGGVDDVEWSYTGEVLATSAQGRFCAGLLCAHGLGKLGTDGGWTYSGTFRYGDIVGQGHGETDDGDYEGLVFSSAYPGGPPPLCGWPKGAVVAAISWHGFNLDVLGSEKPCSGDVCKFLQCLKDWTAKVKSGQAALQDEVLQANRWHDKIRADQIALLGGSASGTFDRVSVAEIEFGDYLISQGWKPRIGPRSVSKGSCIPRQTSMRSYCIWTISRFPTPTIPSS